MQQNSSAQTAKKIIIIIALLAFLLSGMIFSAAAIIIKTIDKTRSEKCTATVTAEVIEMVENSDSSGTYAPKFFYNINGSYFTVIMQSYSNPPKYSAGDKVELRYDPNDPLYIYDDSDNIMNIITIVCASIGGVNILVSIILIIVLGRMSKNSKAAMTDEMSYYYQQ